MRRRYMTFGLLAVTGLTLALTASVGAQGSGDRAIFAVMNGAKEVEPATGDRGTGDPNGRGSFSATLDGRQLCYGIQVKNVNDQVAALILRGGSRVAGSLCQGMAVSAE